MAELGAFFGNPNIQRQGARARALAGQRDVNTLADPRTYAIVQGLLGTAPDQMGFSVLNPDYEKIRKAAEPAFALGLLGQAAPLLAPMTKGLPVGASVKNVGNDLLSYRGSHTAPDRDFGAPLHDLTGGGQMYPADIYSSKAAQIYGGGMPYDQKAFSIAQQYKDKPNALVTIYRAVPKDISNSEKLATLEKQMSAYMKRGTLPKDAENYSSGSKWYDAAYERREALRKMPDEPSNQVNKINAGDWVTLTREYAKDHGESALNGEYKIISQKVKAKDVFTNADSIHEFGYQPQIAKPSQIEAPRQEALDTAQRNAALPVEEGGLGLPKDNTPEMRAEAMGFDLQNPQYHATNVPEDFTSIRPSARGKMGAGIYTSPEAKYAEKYGGNQDVRILPLVSRGEYADADTRENIFDTIRGELYQKNPNFTSQELNNAVSQEMQRKGFSGFDVDKERLTFSPDQMRSRFAAFDPLRIDTQTASARGVAPPDLLAGVLPLGLLADEEQRKKLYELMPSLLGE
jgi:hypothetical protein